jgi:integrase
MLARYGIQPGVPITDPAALSDFYEDLQARRAGFADTYGIEHGDLDPGEYLALHEVIATQMAAGTLKAGLGDALELYLHLHRKRGDKSFVAFTRSAFRRLVNVVGDKPVDDLKRLDAHKAVIAFQRDGLASGSIRRLLAVYAAVMSVYFREQELERRNPFASIPISNEGQDAVSRKPLSGPDLARVIELCREKDDCPRWLVAMLVDTGARVAEVTGLALEDIKLNDPVPHIVIQPHPWRPVKTAGSHRTVPLVGVALWAAQRVIEKTRTGQRVAFPAYTTATRCNAGNVSGMVARWMRTHGIDHTAHELRHTIADRLRDVQCPEDVRLAIGGWSPVGVGNRYGSGYGLKVKAEWLEKIVMSL